MRSSGRSPRAPDGSRTSACGPRRARRRSAFTCRGRLASDQRSMSKIRLGIVGVGNCASSLLQGLEYYRQGEGPKTGGSGLMHQDLGGYAPDDIQVVCAFDIDARKVGRPLEAAAFAPPNNTMTIFPKLPATKVRADMGP